MAATGWYEIHRSERHCPDAPRASDCADRIAARSGQGPAIGFRGGRVICLDQTVDANCRAFLEFFQPETNEYMSLAVCAQKDLPD
jgi:hypothetical protein